MQTTLDLPDSLMRELKTRAARSVQSLKSLLNELIQRALVLPAITSHVKPELPVLARLHGQAFTSSLPLTNAQLATLELDEDLEKLKRSRFLP